METSELRTECRIKHGNHACDAKIHLIELRYSERVIFWNGVLLIARDEVPELKDLGPMPVEVLLPDGRKGVLHIGYGNSVGDLYEIAGAGKPN